MDYLQEIEKYKDFKDIKDFVDDVHKLREYYSTRQYDAMSQHIWNLMIKYAKETVAWNIANTNMPTSPDESYINAENFLRLKGFSMLIKKGINLQNKLNQQELNLINGWLKPQQ